MLKYRIAMNKLIADIYTTQPIESINMILGHMLQGKSSEKNFKASSFRIITGIETLTYPIEVRAPYWDSGSIYRVKESANTFYFTEDEAKELFVVDSFGKMYHFDKDYNYIVEKDLIPKKVMQHLSG